MAMGWFPQEYAQEFNYLKATFALIAAVLLILHMLQIWSHLSSNAQRARYMVLLGYALIICYASLDLARTDATIKSYNVMSMLMTIALILVTLYSIRDWHRSRVT